MAGPCCDNCVYCLVDPEDWPRSQWRGESIVPKCANHPRWPGVVHDVPGVPCENYQPRPMPPENDSVCLISLSGGGYAWVDAADYEWLNRYHWRLTNGYPCRREKGREVSMHRQISAPATRTGSTSASGARATPASKASPSTRPCASGRHTTDSKADRITSGISTTRSRRPGRTTTQPSNISASSPA